MTYRVFVRNWWRRADERERFQHWPGNLVPDPSARKTTLHKRVATEAEAQAICAEYARTHKPGALSRKAEYEEN